MKPYSQLAGKTVLVTGGAGFIGSALTEALLALDCRVVCADDFSTGSRKNTEGFLADPNYTLIEGNICDEDFADRIMAGVDYVLHEAALGSVPRSVEHPAATMKANAGGTAAIFRAAAKAGVKRVVYASSSSVYGDSASLPKREEITGHALSPYALSKQMCEQLAALAFQLYGLKTIGLRYFNVFGRRQNPDGAYAAVIPRFADALIRHRRPVINGNGGITRDFTYVDDVVQANLKALTAGDEACGRAYNIASSREISLTELFRTLRDVLGEKDPEILRIEPEIAPPRAGDVPKSLADISLAGKYLGYRPEYSFSEAIRKTADWYACKNLHSAG